MIYSTVAGAPLDRQGYIKQQLRILLLMRQTGTLVDTPVFRRQQIGLTIARYNKGWNSKLAQTLIQRYEEDF